MKNTAKPVLSVVEGMAVLHYKIATAYKTGPPDVRRASLAMTIYRTESNAALTYKGTSIMFTTVMIIAVAVLGIAWAIYGIYEYKMRQEEKKQPKQISERLQKTKSEVADYAKKLAEYKPPKRKPPPPPPPPGQT